jgi:pyridoxal phosphate enzyme (YggS family)
MSVPTGLAAYDAQVVGHDFNAARGRILEAVATAARRVRRDATEIETVAVAKTVPASRVRAAVEAGFTTIGENRVQEAESKVEAVNAGFERPPRWHLVGPLQSNKVRRAVGLFDVIETIDSGSLAGRVDRAAAELRPGRRYPVLLQVNVDDDPSKAGFEPAALEDELEPILELPNLRVAGLMTVGRLVPDAEAARPTFVALHRLSERLRARDDRLGPALSMGMTDDFEVAIEEGATIVRIGRAIFGHRH